FAEVGADDRPVPVLAGNHHDSDSQRDHRRQRRYGEHFVDVLSCAQGWCPALAGEQDVGHNGYGGQSADNSCTDVQRRCRAQLQQFDLDEVLHFGAPWAGDWMSLGWTRLWKVVSRPWPAPTIASVGPAVTRWPRWM